MQLHQPCQPGFLVFPLPLTRRLCVLKEQRRGGASVSQAFLKRQPHRHGDNYGGNRRKGKADPKAYQPPTPPLLFFGCQFSRRNWHNLNAPMIIWLDLQCR